MQLIRNGRHMALATVVAILMIEIVVDLAHHVVAGLGTSERVHVILDLLQLATTLVVLLLAANRMRQATRSQQMQSRHYARLCELGHAACSEPDESKMLKRCATLLVDVLKCDAAGFVQPSDDGKSWLIRTTAGRYAGRLPSEQELPRGAGTFGDYVMHTAAQPVHVFKVAHENRFNAPRVLGDFFSTCLAARVHLDTSSYGVLVAVYRKPTPADAHNAAFVRSLSNILARYLQTNRALVALKSSEELFLQLAEHIGDVLYVANADGSKVHYVSPAYERVWHASASALYRNPRAWLDPIHEDDRDMGDRILHAHAEGRYCETNFRLVQPDGTVRWICDRSFPVQMTDGGVPRVAGLATDVTEVLQARDLANQLELSDERTARAKAETRIRTRDEVLAIVSHDLRTPLTAIAMSAQRLVAQCAGDDKTAKLASRIDHAAGRMERLVQDLLEVSRLESGVLRLERRDMACGELWQEAAEAFEVQGGPVTVSFAPIDPRAGILCVDAMRILQALGNLITNAVGFSPAGGVVRVSGTLRDGALVCCVEDAGPGIAAEQIAHLFEPFWQGSRRDGRGLGLGLHIAKGIVEAHGGTIGAHGLQPQGTAVWFSLPHGPRAADAAQALEAAATASAVATVGTASVAATATATATATASAVGTATASVDLTLN